MDWWRNERKITDANFETKIVHGSPAYLPSKRPSKLASAAQAARQKIQEIYEAQRRRAEWSNDQLAALRDAKVAVPTTHPNFWAQVAERVPGKTADDCRARSFDELPVAPTRKNAIGTTKQAAQPQVPVKIHRAGSNLFKKQVRQFVHDQEQKNVDDLFSQSTPSKAAITGTADLDDLKSPGGPAVENVPNADESDDENFLRGAGRELLEKVSLSKRDEVDSYVRTLKKRNDSIGLKAVRTAKSSEFSTPQQKKKRTREGVHMVAEVGTHRVEGIVTPGGTTRVQVNRGSDSEEIDEDDDDEEEALSEGY